MHRRLAGLVFALAMALSLGISPRSAAAHQLCFPGDKTPHCLNDPFADYWETNGGLPVFGYPISAAAAEANADTGQTYTTQWVERTRMEDHPENQPPYQVLLGLLGKERLRQLGRDPGAEPREAGPKDGCLWFDQTGHNVCNISGNLGFRQYWESHGLKIDGMSTFDRSLQLFGLPLTEPKQETNASGDTVLTQWFERARFEWHPGNPDEYKVLLGLLGTEVHGTTPAPPPADPCADTPDPVSGRIRPAKCGVVGTVFEIDVFGFTPNELVDLTLTSPDGQDFSGGESFSIGPAGGIDGVPIDTDGLSTGIWALKFQGLSSGHQSIISFKLLPVGGTPPPPPAPASPPPPATPTPRANCDPSYPDVCIPPPPPDLDCGDISYRNFRVLQPDPHRFDRDNDGIGCES